MELMSLRFPKSSRLLQRSQFLHVQQHGKKIVTDMFLALFLAAETTGQGIRVGFTTSRKIGNAVYRNRIRRLMREASRKLLLPLALDLDIVLIAKKKSGALPSQKQMDESFVELIRQLEFCNLTRPVESLDRD